MHRAWNKYAFLRKKQIETGVDTTFSDVFVPYYVELIKRLSPAKVLEIGSGTGHLAKELSLIVPKMVLLEPCQNMQKVSRGVLHDIQISVESCRIEEYLPSEKFDLIISHLCIQSVKDINLFLSAAKSNLHEDGLFIFSIPHPCFWNGIKEFIPLCDYRYFKHVFKKVDFFLEKDKRNIFKGIPYFHRSLNGYFNTIRNSGLLVVYFDEIYTESQEELQNKNCNPRYAVFYLSPDRKRKDYN